MLRNTLGILVVMVVLFSCKEKDRKITSDLLNFPQTASGDANDQQPKIVFDSLEYTFGEIAIGEKVEHTYIFKNEGDGPLIIADVKPSCGCTALKDWSKDPILPGEKGQISIEFNSSGFPGPISKSIKVSTNAQPNDVYLKLKGQVNGVEKVDEVKPGIEMTRTQ